MGAGDVKIRVLHNFSCYERGQVFSDWPGGMCDILVRRGLIEEVQDTEVEEAVEHREVERADASPKHRKKK
jgi:hypothetical protein